MGHTKQELSTTFVEFLHKLKIPSEFALLFAATFLAACASAPETQAHEELPPPSVDVVTVTVAPTETIEPTQLPSTPHPQTFTVEDNATWEETAHLYQDQGEPFPGIQTFIDRALTEGETLYTVPIVPIEKSIPVEDVPENYRELIQPFLNTGYELFGKERALDGLHSIVIMDDTCVCSAQAGGYRIYIPSNMEKTGNGWWFLVTSIHEWIHLFDLGFNLHTPESLMEMEAIKAKLLLKFDIENTYSQLYGNLYYPAEITNSFFYMVGNNFYVFMNDDRATNLGYDSDPQFQLLRDQIAQLESDADGMSELDKFTLGQFIAAWHRGKLMAFPPELEEMYEGPFTFYVTTEAFAAIMSDILVYTPSKYANDPEAVELARRWVEIARYGKDADHVIDITDLRNRLQHPTGALPIQDPDFFGASDSGY